MKTVLTIAGFDPSGGAGIQADLLTFRDFKVRGLSTVTAVTVQDSKKVYAVKPITPALLKKQIETLLKDFNIDAVKIGMLGKGELADVVSKLIKKHTLTDIILDPVLRSTSGYPLIDRKGVPAIKRLLPLVKIVTPNIDEAIALSGIKIKKVKDMERAAEKIHSLGPKYVLIKGGHLKGAPTDVLYDGKEFTHFKGSRVNIKGTRHGTGCVLSSAIAAGIARGKTVKRAVDDGKKYVMKSLKTNRG